MAQIFWEFVLYSFLGYLLEKGYARATGAENQTRKCFLVLPLCPVYGLGMTTLLAMPEPWLRGGWLLITGAVVTTVVEYVVHWGYETFLHVRFWDYHDVTGNLRGRICLPFTAAWGVLSAAAVILIQPMLLALISEVSAWATLAAIMFFTADAVCSVRLLRMTGDTGALRFTELRNE